MTKTFTKSLLTVLFLLFSTQVHAMKDFQVIIPYAVSGGVSQFFRILQSYASNKGINLIPVFKPGAEGTVGLNDAASGMHNPDKTIVLTVISDMWSDHKAKKFDQNYFVPVANLAQSKVYIVAGNHVPVNNLSELFNSVKKNPEQLTWAISSSQFYKDLNSVATSLGTDADHMIITKFNGASSLPNVIGGYIDIGVYPATSVQAMIDDKKLKLLGTYRRKDAQGLNVDSIENHMNVLKRDGFGLFLLPGISPNVSKFWEQFCQDFLNDPDTPNLLVKRNFRMPENGTIKDIYNEFNKNKISLTRREEEIAGLIRIRGLSNQQISQQLGIGESAVKLHVTHILKKYNIHSRTQLAAFG